jgi:hypothetical protein
MTSFVFFLSVAACDTAKGDDVELSAWQKLRDALVVAVSTHEADDVRELAKELKSARVHVEGNRVYIGPWVHEKGSAEVTRYLTPGREVGHEYVAHIKRASGNWLVQRIERREVRVRGNFLK